MRWLPVQNQAGHFVARNDSSAGGLPKDSDQIRIFRRYVGVVTEAVEAADGRIRLKNRGNGFPTVRSDELVWVEGDLRIEGDLRLFNHKLDFRDSGGSDNGVPLSINRVDDAGGRLQVVIGKSSAGANTFAVGPLDGSNQLNAKLSVRDDGKVGIGTATPALTLDVQGDFGRDDGPATLHLWGSRIGDAGNMTLFVRAFDNGVVAFDGTNNLVGVGTNQPVAKLGIAGDIALHKIDGGVPRPLPVNATMFWNDGTWLRLNQNLDFSKPIFGIHTPGLFAPGSLNVGGAGGWGDPGFGNVWVTGTVGIGTTAPATQLHVLGNRIRLENLNKHVDLRTDGSAVDLHSETNHLYVRSSGPGGNNNVIINPFPEDGNVGIGTQVPADKLHVEGNLRVTGTARGGPWTGSSDARLKTKVGQLKGALDKMLQLRGLHFEWKDPQKMGNRTGTQMGLMAQEVEKTFPEWVSTDPDGYKELTIRGFEALTIEAFRELKNDVETLKKQVDKIATSRQRGKKEQKEKSP